MADRGQSADFHEFGAAVGAGVVVGQQPATLENRTHQPCAWCPPHHGCAPQTGGSLPTVIGHRKRHARQHPLPHRCSRTRRRPGSVDGARG